MTLVAERSRAIEAVNCEVRCPGRDEVLGYVVGGRSAGCLEKALADNGLSLVPVGPEPLAKRPVRAVA